MARRWTLYPVQHDLAKTLAGALSVHPLVGHLLVNRGVVTLDQGRAFLDRRLNSLHDPDELPGVSEAAERIHRAATAGKKICIYGDYDVDGMCATAILLELLRLAGASARSYVPDRIEEGYGVNAEALQRLRQDGIDLVITVDCGIASVAEAELARSIGLEYIVTDHHQPGAQVPNADAVVHPSLPGSTYPFPHLCGAGVALKLAWQLARLFSGQRKVTDRYQKFLLDATILAAVATVCDVVPLLGENRILVHHGLSFLKQAPPIGLQRLMEVSGLDKKEKLTSGDIGFTLGPRLNACGRLGQARLGVELLTSRDPQRCLELARYLEDENKVRQTLERRIFSEAKAMAEETYDLTDEMGCSAIVLASESEKWHPGVIGIVASRMVEKFHRPCLLISLREDSGTGSGRSVPGFDLQRALAACGEHLIKSGGHAMAAGLRVARERFEQFREQFHEYAAGGVQRYDRVAEVRVDAEAQLHALTPRFVQSLEALEPFGLTNPSPLLVATDLEVVGEPKRVGGGERHLSFRVRQGSTVMKGIAFEQGERAGELVSRHGKCCVVFSPMINMFRGFPDVELRVKDFRPGARIVDEAPVPCPTT